MTKILACNDLFPGCDYAAKGETEEDVLKQAAEHAAARHGLTELNDETVAQVRSCIHEA